MAEEKKVVEETKEETKVEETKETKEETKKEEKKPMITKEKLLAALKIAGAMIGGSAITIAVLAFLGRNGGSNIIDSVATEVPTVPMPLPQVPALPEMPVATAVEQAVEATNEVVNQ